jgi:penicillin-binding protein 1C
MDPRIADDYEYFEFALTDLADIEQVRWFVNEKLVATTKSQNYHWKLSPGSFSTHAEVLLRQSTQPVKTGTFHYHVN